MINPNPKPPPVRHRGLRSRAGGCLLAYLIRLDKAAVLDRLLLLVCHGGGGLRPRSLGNYLAPSFFEGEVANSLEVSGGGEKRLGAAAAAAAVEFGCPSVTSFCGEAEKRKESFASQTQPSKKSQTTKNSERESQRQQPALPARPLAPARGPVWRKLLLWY